MLARDLPNTRQDRIGVSRRRYGALLAAILVLGIGLRVPMLGADGFWLDEAIAASLAMLPFGEFLEHVRIDTHPPLHFAVLKLVHSVVGTALWSEAVVRSVSLFFGVAGIWMIARVATQLLGSVGGLFAAALLATNPMHVHYSREGRGYTLLILLIIAAVGCVSALRVRPSALRGAACGALFALLAYCHNIAYFVLCPLAGWLVWPCGGADRTRYRRAVLVAGLTAAVLCAPWLPTVFQQASRVSQTSVSGSGPIEWVATWWDRTFPFQIPWSIAAMSHGSPPAINNSVLDVPPLAAITGAASSLVIAAGLLPRSKWAVPGTQWPVLALLVMPLVLLFLASWIGTPIYSTGRVDTVALPAFILLIAAGLSFLWSALPAQPRSEETSQPEPSSTVAQRPSNRRAQVVVVSLLGAFVAAALPSIVDEIRDLSGASGRTMALGIAHSARDNDVLLVTGKWRSLVDYYAARAGRRLHLVGFPVAREQHPNWLRWTEYDTARVDQDAEAVSRRALELSRKYHGTVWVASSFQGAERLHPVLARSFLRVSRETPPGFYALTPRGG